MANYTTTQAGNWTDAATWGGGGFPSSSADTATIGHTVTLQSGQSITCGAITLNADTLQINGTLTLSAAVSLVGAYTLAIGAGGTLDLGGQTITPSGSGIGSYNFIGTAVSRATVIGNGGFFAAAGTKALLPHIEYCDFSDLIDSYLGRTQTSNLTVIMRYSTVTNCAAFYLDTTGVGANAGFIVEYCDFSDWRSPTAQPANDFQPGIYQTKLTSTAPRVLRHCTFDNSMNAVQGAAEFRTAGAIYEHNVICIVNELAVDKTITV